MKRFAIFLSLMILAVPAVADFAGTGFSSPPLPSMAGQSGKYLTNDNSVASWGTVTGTGTLTGPATATENNMATWGADNATLKDSGVAVPNQALSTTSSPTFAGITVPSVTSNAADNTHYVQVGNTADPTGANLKAGAIWVTDNSVKARSNDNSVTFIAGSLIKTKSFGWDNAATTDNTIFLGTEWSPVATTLISIKCFASTDNVIGVLSECAADNNASCTKVDDTDWTITNAVTGVTVLAADFENSAIAAGASLKWDTTSVGSALNRFSCTVRYRE